MATDLQDKVAIVTGGAGGIGKAYARALAERARGRDRRPQRRRRKPPRRS